MLAQYPAEVTDAEREAKGVTKHRWMDVHDRSSTTRSLGYRIGGVAGYGKSTKAEVDDQFKHIRTQNHACQAFQGLVEEVAAEVSIKRANSEAIRTAIAIRDDLCQLRSVLEKSKFFARHECIGTSVLLVADASGRTGAFWIDFAKTQPLDDGLNITHRKSWEAGNHEDGLLYGIDNMISAWDSVVRMLYGDMIASQKSAMIACPLESPEQNVCTTACLRSCKQRSRSVSHRNASCSRTVADRKTRRCSTVASNSSLIGVVAAKC
jgi:hypothetical protein